MPLDNFKDKYNLIRIVALHKPNELTNLLNIMVAKYLYLASDGAYGYYDWNVVKLQVASHCRG